MKSTSRTTKNALRAVAPARVLTAEYAAERATERLTEALAAISLKLQGGEQRKTGRPIDYGDAGSLAHYAGLAEQLLASMNDQEETWDVYQNGFCLATFGTERQADAHASKLTNEGRINIGVSKRTF